MATKNVLAFDLGASSGRGMLAHFDGNRITLEEVHRFEHNFSMLDGCNERRHAQMPGTVIWCWF